MNLGISSFVHCVGAYVKVNVCPRGCVIDNVLNFHGFHI